MASRIALVAVICLSVGFAGGYQLGVSRVVRVEQVKPLEPQQNITTAYNLQVVSKLSANSFWLRMPDVIDAHTGKIWEGLWKFCEPGSSGADYVPDWSIGSIVESVTYDDQPPCKSVKARNLGFSQARNEQHQLIKFGE